MAGASAILRSLDAARQVAADLDGARAEQLPLAGIAPEPIAEPDAPEPTGRPGRPPGSRNRINDRADRYLASIGARHPVAVLAEIMGGRPFVEQVAYLSAALDCEQIEAAKLVERAASDLMPYVARRKPQELESRSYGLNVLHIATGSGAPGAPEAGISAVLEAVRVNPESEEFQALIEAEAEQSEDEDSE
jgi:hypothetical protein